MGLVSGILALFIFMLMSIVVIELLWRIKFIADLGRKKAYAFATLYIGALAVIMFAPTVINDALSSTSTTYKTAPDLGNQEWLGFWGSYMGGVVGAIVTGGAFYFTYKQNQKQHEETRIQNEEQHKQTRELMLDQQRLQILPVLAITGVAYGGGFHLVNQCLTLSSAPSDKKVMPTCLELYLTNISSSPALFFELEGSSGCLCGHILPNQQVKCHIGIPAIDEDREYHFNLIFNDSLGNKYFQSVTCRILAGVLKASEAPYFSQPAFPKLLPREPLI